MKQQHKWLACLFLLFAGLLARAQPTGWWVDAQQYQYGMTLVAQLQLDGTPNHLAGNYLAAFSKGQIRGYAEPVKVNGQVYYFMNLYANQFKGDTLYFRAFLGATQQVYESVDTLVFRHQSVQGKMPAPFMVDLNLGTGPLLYSPTAFTYVEGSCGTIADLQSSDDVDTEGNGLTYSIVGGADAGRFALDAQTGVLSWAAGFVPTVDDPGDADLDNRYEVRVRVTDATNRPNEQTLVVTVTKNTGVLAPLSCPDNVTVNTADDGPGNCTALVALPVNPPPSLCEAASLGYRLSGATTGQGALQTAPLFTKGVTTVAYERNGQSACTFSVTVLDNEKPAITCPADATVAADENCSGPVGAYALAEKSDNCSAPENIAVQQMPAATTVLNGHNAFRTVTLTANDGNGNTQTCQFAVTLKDRTPPTIACPANTTVAAGANCSAALGQYVLLSKSDHCNAPANITVAQSPEATTVLSGHNTAQTVTLTANDGNGNTQSCQFTVTLKDVTPPTLACPQNQTVSPTVNTPCSAVVNGINAVFGDACGASLAYTRSGTMTGSGNGQASGLTFNEGTTTVVYRVTDGAQAQTSCSFTVQVMSCVTGLSGRVIWERDRTSGVKDVTMSITGDFTGTVATSATGAYNKTLAPNVNVSITPSKDLNKLNGVNASDVQRIQQHLGSNPITNPWQLIAADVNSNNTVTSLDANIIQLSLLNNPQALAQFVKSWRFVPTTHTMASPPWGFPEKITLSGVSGPQPNKDFYGIKVGDVAAVYANPANAGHFLTLRVSDKPLLSGETLIVDVEADPVATLAALQLALRFDPSRLQLTDIEPLGGLPLSADNFGAHDLAEGSLRLVWAAAQDVSIKQTTNLFRLRFRVLESGGRLSDVLSLDEEALPAHTYTGAQAESGVVLQYRQNGTSSAAEANAFRAQLLQNIPNPFLGQTTIAFVLPEACEARLRVLDARGRVVAERSGRYAAGRHEEPFAWDGASGVLYYELVTPSGVLVRKMEKL